MREPVYKYDPSTLRYIKTTVRWDRALLKGFSFLLLTGCLLGLMLKAYLNLFQSDRQRMLSLENDAFSETKASMIGELNTLQGEIDELQLRESAIQRRLYFSEQSAEKIDNNLLMKKLAADQQLADFGSEEFSRILDRTNYMVVQATRQAESTNNSFSYLFWPKKEDIIDLKRYPTFIPIKDFKPEMIACGFGEQINPFNKKVIQHTGLDILTEIGSMVLAAADGVIKEVQLDQSPAGSGTFILIDHGNGYQTKYSRLAESNLRRGQIVRQGQSIGSVGKTGSSFAPHLHYEVIASGKTVDPVPFLVGQISAKDLESVKKASSEKRQSLD